MADFSPMMKQYLRIKEEHQDCVLFFRLGDFYEMFFEDAKIVSEELDLVLTGKECGLKERAPMCGVPFHSCDAYIARLVRNGHKVAICEQLEDPVKGKKLVDRGVVRIITPGTVIDENMLEEGKNNYLGAISFAGNRIGLCFADASTGACSVTEIDGDRMERRVIDELMRFQPSELLYNGHLEAYPLLQVFLTENFEGTLSVRDAECFERRSFEPLLQNHFEVNSLEDLGITVDGGAAAAAGVLIGYLYETCANGPISVDRLQYYTESQFMRLDMTAIRNLELCETMRTKAKKGSLLWVLDKTKTAMGKRLLRSWLEKPLLSITEITLRQNALEELCGNPVMLGETVDSLTGVRDIERLITKAVYGSASAKDLNSIAETVRRFPRVKSCIADARCKMLRNIGDNLDTLEDVADLIQKAIMDNPAPTLKDGGIIRDGYHAELDELRSIMHNGGRIITDIENRERERTGIKTLRVRYNKVFGYYIEVTNSFLDKVPEDYIRRQTLTNAERFVTEELKDLESRVLTAKDRVAHLEFDLFDEVRQKTSAELERFQKSANLLAQLDVLCSLSTVAVRQNYCRPVVDNSGLIQIKNGRHPVVEQMIRTPFVENDTLLDKEENRCAIITGPNMAGKSTYMRQVALITLMAQIGSFVPAQMAQIGLCDAIYTRVGASDDLASGRSTFMVEMSEVADILKNATRNSLLILDEIGRGTSTFDGMSIARAVLEYVADKKKLGAKSLFATHYHELTEMEQTLNGVKNYNIAAKKRGDDIIFLRRVVRGGADDSYGIEVAKLSGIPDSVIRRAKEVLHQTLTEGIVTYKTVASAETQLPMELQGASELLQELQLLDVNTLTPIEAMGILFDLANKAKSVAP
ncbi:MAG: DNA mismatch repair protein MutS [Clostridia bacterium]|nr:DNA mismatch repair protein MutS [Clostridia bacterium]